MNCQSGQISKVTIRLRWTVGFAKGANHGIYIVCAPQVEGNIIVVLSH